MSDVKRMVFLPLDKKHQNYDESNIVVGELVMIVKLDMLGLKLSQESLFHFVVQDYIDLN